MSFGESLLKKFGWKEGQGLGLEETGIKTALRPKLKFDTLGFGCNKSEEFTTHWWDHVYNKTAKNISINKNEAGEIHITKEEEVKVSTKRLKKKVKKDVHYGNFIKGSVLLGSTEIADDESAEILEEDQELIKKFSDDELFRRCGGLTAHKGARHGLTMSAKLARLQQQEAAFMTGQNNAKPTTPIDLRETKGEKKRKRKLKEEGGETVLNTITGSITTDTEFQQPSESSKKRKKKKKDRYREASAEDTTVDNGSLADVLPEVSGGSHGDDDGSCDKIKRKAKKKKRKHCT